MRGGPANGMVPARAAIAAALVMAGLGPASPAVAAGPRRLDSAWLLPAALHGHLLGDLTAGPGPRGAWLRAGQARLYGMAELPVRLVGFGIAGRGWVLDAGWETLGAGPLRDDRAQAAFAVGANRRLGLRASRRGLRPGPGEAGAAGSIDLEAVVAGHSEGLGQWRLAGWWPLLQTADPWVPAEPETRLRGALAGRGRGLAVSFDIAADGSPAFGWEALASLGGRLALSWRADAASGATGGGLLWRSGGIRLRTSHLAHPELGLTHRAEICFGNAGGAAW